METSTSPRTIAPDDSLSSDVADDLDMLNDLKHLIDAGLVAVHQDADDTTEPRFYVTTRGRAAHDRNDDDESPC